MINLFKKSKPRGEIITIKIKGMHCTNCAMNIDNILEETKGIYNSSTNYAKQESKIEFDDKKIQEAKIKNIIKNLGYNPID